MISPFDGELPGMPSRDALRRTNVSRLEFEVLDRWNGETAVEGGEKKTAAMAVDAELRLREEVAVLEGRLSFEEQQFSARMEAARQVATEQARAAWDQELEERVAQARRQVAHICAEFARERTRYFLDVEEEVVRLALAIAARVLHREAGCDPLLLRGAVRVALEQVADNSATILRIPATEATMWREALHTGAKSEVQLQEDETLRPGECILETSAGRVDLGVKAQLVEIERGLFDLIEKRPA